MKQSQFNDFFCTLTMQYKILLIFWLTVCGMIALHKTI